MTEKCTAGPWTVDVAPDAAGFHTIRIANGTCYGDTDQQPIATVYDKQHTRLIAAAPVQFALIEHVYILLADVRNQWDGRHSAAGQHLLSALRDSICAVTGREA